MKIVIIIIISTQVIKLIIPLVQMYNYSFLSDYDSDIVAIELDNSLEGQIPIKNVSSKYFLLQL